MMIVKNRLIVTGENDQLDRFVLAVERPSRTPDGYPCVLSFGQLSQQWTYDGVGYDNREYCSGLAYYRFETGGLAAHAFAEEVSPAFPGLVFEVISWGESGDDWLEHGTYCRGARTFFRSLGARYDPSTFYREACATFSVFRDDPELRYAAIDPQDMEEYGGCWEADNREVRTVQEERAERGAAGDCNWRKWKRWHNTLTLTGSTARVARCREQIESGSLQLASVGPLRPTWTEDVADPDLDQQGVDLTRVVWAEYRFRSHELVDLEPLLEITRSAPDLTIQHVKVDILTNDPWDVCVKDPPGVVLKLGTIRTPSEGTSPSPRRGLRDIRWQDAGF